MRKPVLQGFHTHMLATQEQPVRGEQAVGVFPKDLEMTCLLRTHRELVMAPTSHILTLSRQRLRYMRMGFD